LRVLGAGCAQHLEARRITVIELVAEAPHEVDLRLAHLERREADLPCSQHARHDLAKPSEAGDQHARLSGSIRS